MTRGILSLAAAFVLVGVASVWPAWAQDPALTGTGGGPDSTITAPNTNSLGVTKPPGAALGPEPNEDSPRRTRIEKEGDRIDSGICIGCGT